MFEVNGKSILGNTQMIFRPDFLAAAARATTPLQVIHAPTRHPAL
jgi:hypothetical protein